MVTPFPDSTPKFLKTLNELNHINQVIKSSKGRLFATIDHGNLTFTQHPDKAARLNEIRSFVSEALIDSHPSSEQLITLEKEFKKFVKYYQTASARKTHQNLNKILDSDSPLGKIIARVISSINRQVTSLSPKKRKTLNQIKAQVQQKTILLNELKQNLLLMDSSFYERTKNKIDQMSDKQLVVLNNLINMKRIFTDLGSQIEKQIAQNMINQHLQGNLTKEDFENTVDRLLLLRTILAARPHHMKNEKINEMTDGELTIVAQFIHQLENPATKPPYKKVLESVIEEILDGKKISQDEINLRLAKASKKSNKKVSWKKNDEVFSKENNKIIKDEIPTNPNDRSYSKKEFEKDISTKSFFNLTDKDILQLQGIMARERINDDLPVSMRLKMIQKPTHEKVLENPLWFDQILDSFEASLNKFASLNEEISNKNQLLLKYVLSAVLDDVDEALKSGEPVDKIKAECLSKFRSELLLTRADDEELNDPALMDVRKTLVSLPTANIAVNLLSKILDQEIDWPNTKS